VQDQADAPLDGCCIRLEAARHEGGLEQPGGGQHLGEVAVDVGRRPLLAGGLSPPAIWIIRSRADDPYQFAGEIGIDADRSMDSARERDEIRVDGTDDDSGMSRSLAMELHEVFSVQCQDSALIREGGIEDIVVTHPLP